MGVKVATEQFHSFTTVSDSNHPTSAQEVDEMSRLVGVHLRGVSRNPVRMATCLYTVTPDRGFIIDRHPELANVILASPCSGRGFKHSPAIGELLASFALDDKDAERRLEPFSMGRFG